MFELELTQKFKNIFKLNKVTFDSPGESMEQNCLFVEIEVAKNTIKDGKEQSKVTGTIYMIAPNDKLKFGFFSKAIAKASNIDTENLFFSDFEGNSNRFRNLVQRSCSFTYFFYGQFDPSIGTIESIDVKESET